MPKNWLARIGGLGIAVWLTAACSLTNTAPESVALVFEGPPTITIASPLASTVYLEGTPINILARIENAGADIQRVEIRVGDEVVAGEDNPNASGSAAFTLTSSWVATRTGGQSISVMVMRGDSLTSAMETVSIEVRARTLPTPTLTPTLAATVPSAATATPAPVQPEPAAATATPAEQAQPPAQGEPPAQPTSSVPRVRLTVGANIRSGPATSFDPPLGALPAGSESDILAQAPGGLWFKIRFYNATGWISASVVEVIGDTASVPIEAGPPTPQPVVQQPPPAVTPAPAQPAAGADLVVDGVPNINPYPFSCGDASEIYVVVKNIGTARAEGGRLAVRDLKDGAVQAQTEANYGPLDPGASQTIGPMYLTVSTFVQENHVTTVTVDVGSSVAEANEGNNTYTSPPYPLQSGSGC